MSVKSRILLFFFTAVLSLSFFFSFLFERNARTIFWEMLSYEAKRLEDLARAFFEEEGEQLFVSLRDYARWTETGEKGVVERDPEWLRENLYPWVGENFGYEVLLVKGKEVIIVSPGWPFSPSDLPQETENPWVGAYGDGERLFLVAIHPVTDSYGERQYGALLSFARPCDAEFFEHLARRVGGTVEYHPQGKGLVRGFSFVDSSSLTLAGGSLAVSPDFTGEGGKVLGEFLFTKDVRSILRLYATSLRIFFFSLLGAILFILLLVRFLVERMLRPLNQLQHAAARVGQGEYDVELEVHRKDEIGALSAAFAAMVGALKRREAELRREKEHSERLANLDALTGIPNRRLLRKRVEEYISRGEPFTLVFIDLDRFKSVNALLGHTGGDQVLQRVALWFAGRIRRGDIVARYGGDEFCFLFPGLGKEEAEGAVARLAAEFSEEDFWGDTPLGFSFGVAMYPDDGKTIDELLRRANEEMYAQKQGKSSVNP